MSATVSPVAPALSPPFDAAHLDRLMEDANLDVLLISSKHNVQYLLGGHRFFFFDYMDAIGVSRYLPILVYPKGRPDLVAYVGNEMEAYEQEFDPLWVPSLNLAAWRSVDAVQLATSHVLRNGIAAARIGIETAFLPADAYDALRRSLPNSDIADALVVLERLRARKTPEELAMLRDASEKVVDSMMSVIASHGPGSTKRQLVDALRREEVARGLTFEYCLIAMGSSFNRAPSDQAWREGDVLSLDSGGNFHGYIGDLARMAVLGEPDPELEHLLGVVDEIQQAARHPIRAGRRGGDIFAAAETLIARSPERQALRFVAHGMGLIAHEAPRLTATGPVPYTADDAERLLEPGMVLSIETAVLHSKRGFIKLEDTIAVTEDGYEAFGDRGRGWNRGAQGIRAVDAGAAR